MDPVIKVSAPQVAALAHGRDNFQIVRIANGDSPHRGGPLPLWLTARARTLGIRRDDLVRLHWRKVWRSMCED